jgi:hypothetical protein
LSSATINFQLSAKDKHVEYEVLTAVVMKISNFGDTTHVYSIFIVEE